MVGLTALWLPIVLGTVIAYLASFVMNAVLTHHISDWPGIPNAGIRVLNLGPGQYVFPEAMTREGMKQEGAAEKIREGPVGYLVIARPGFPHMPKLLTYQFLYMLAVTFAVAYVASRTLDPGAEYLAVFRIVGTVAFLAYSAAEIPQAIWFARPWSASWKYVFDGLVYGLLTAGVFGWLWPAS